MKTSFKIASLLDIPIKLHFSFIIILALFAYVFSFENLKIFSFTIGYGGIGASNIVKIFLGIFLAVLFFVCVLLHELSHSYVTQRNGFKINGITLFVFGGASQMEETPKDPNTEIKIAAAGPVVSFVLSGLFFSFFYLTGFFEGNLFTNVLLISFGTLTFYNFILGLFNLVPAYPTDGGRLVRASLAKTMDYGKATSWASRIGRGIAVAMAVFGILSLNIWLVLIAVFLFFGAMQEEKITQISQALKDKNVEDIMDENISSVSPDMNIKDFLDFLKKKRNTVFPVVKDESIIGVISLDDVQETTGSDLDTLKVEDVMNKDFSKVSSDKKAFSVFKTLAKDKYNHVFVEVDNKLKGVVTMNDITHALKMSEI